MSTGYSYFFNCNKPLETLAEEINEGIGGSFILRKEQNPDPDMGPIYDGAIAGIWVMLYKHDLDWDASTYDLTEDVTKFALDEYEYRMHFVVTSPNNTLLNVIREAIVITIWALYFRLRITGLWCYEADTVMANYVEQNHPKNGRSSLYDTISGSYIGFREHLDNPWCL